MVHEILPIAGIALGILAIRAALGVENSSGVFSLFSYRDGMHLNPPSAKPECREAGVLILISRQGVVPRRRRRLCCLRSASDYGWQGRQSVRDQGRLRALGDGYADGLAGLARDYGVEVA